jgi:hypothetical protein
MTTTITSFIEKETMFRRQSENQSELVRMNNLNMRFMNFLDLVKCETKRSEYLQACLSEQKQELVISLKENYSKYYEDLFNTKKCLNEVTYDLNAAQVTERSNRIKIEWFSKLLRFELDNLNHRPRFNAAYDLPIDYQLSQLLSLPTTTNAASMSHEYENTNYCMSNHSNMSTSQTSLSSMSCSSSSNSYCEEIMTTINCYQQTDAQVCFYMKFFLM